MAVAYFAATRLAYDRITEVYDFLWPTTAAMWNLRWQVRGFCAVLPDVGDTELESRFIAGSRIHGANLRRACLDTTWEQQQAAFARLLLIDLCAIYEAWAAAVLRSIGSTSKSDLRDLQFPTGVDKKKKPAGVATAIKRLTIPDSQTLSRAFYKPLKTARQFSGPHLEALLHCYRYFKACRNCFVHEGGHASLQAETAYKAFVPHATTNALGISEVPRHDPIVAGAPMTLHLRGIVGLSQVIARVVATIDAELSRALSAEGELLTRWSAMHGRRYTLKTKDKVKRANQVRRLITKLGMPPPDDVSGLTTLLRAKRLVS